MSHNYKRQLLAGPPGEPRHPLSLQLREVNRLLGSRERDEALRLLAQSTRLARSEIDRAKIANLVAQSQFALGRYENAATRYRQAARLGAADGLDEQKFLGPALGVIRCLLKNQQLEEAHAEALTLADLVRRKQQTFDQQTSLSPTQLRQIQSLAVGARPVRPSVALTRIGVTFLEEGYIDAGKTFLEEVLAQNPRGASRARQFLAKALLLEGQAERAETLARESLVHGEFRAKTIPSWVLSIQARKLAGKPLLDPELYQDFQRSRARGRVAERAEAVIISELRRQNDSSWLPLAESWRTAAKRRDPIVRVEILKMMLGEVKAGRLHTDAPAPAAISLVREILQEPTLAKSESVGLAKTLGEFGIGAGMTSRQREAWLQRVETRFGTDSGLRAHHAYALGLLYSGHHDFARIAFERLIARVTDNPDAWGKAVWSLARLEAGLDRAAQAATHYLEFAGNPRIQPTLRLQAFLRWIRQAEKSGETIDLPRATVQVDALVASLDDHRPLLDAARQLSLAGPRFHPIFLRVSDVAQRRAILAFQQATTTQEALKILLPLTRRLYYDFHLPERVTAFYESLSEEKMSWLWSHDARFWEYLSLVMRSHLVTGSVPKGVELGRSSREDPTTPPLGRVYLAVHYALWLNDQGRLSEALPFFATAMQEGPNHRLSAFARYWTALVYLHAGRTTQATDALLLARRCLLPRPGLLTEWQLDAKAGLLLRRLDAAHAEARLELYKADFLEAQNNELSADLRRVEQYL